MKTFIIILIFIGFMVNYNINGSRILIIGGTGSWGHELVKRLLNSYDASEIIIFSRGEVKQHEMSKLFNHPKLTFVIGDVRDSERLNLVMQGVDLVVSLAALKHVPICEENPWEAVSTNIVGTNNAIQAAVKNKVNRFVLVSTDKAVDPYNLYGVTKACAEKLVINANNYYSDTTFMCVRGGNVLGTNGSVLPVFKRQLATNNKLSITDPSMTRFLMSLSDAMNLLTNAIESGIGGEIFVMKMDSAKLSDVAKAMIELYGNSETQTVVCGSRPGEKQHELLVSKNESKFSVEKGGFFIVLPTTGTKEYRDNLLNHYLSENKLESNMEYSSNSDQLLISYEGVKSMIGRYFCDK